MHCADLKEDTGLKLNAFNKINSTGYGRQNNNSIVTINDMN